MKRDAFWQIKYCPCIIVRKCPFLCVFNIHGFSGTGSPSFNIIVHTINHSHKTRVQRLEILFSRSTPLFQSGAPYPLLRITVKLFIPLGLGGKLWFQNKTLRALFCGYLIFISKYALLCNKTAIRYENNFSFETDFII
jgi:hypothetical protein